MSKPQGKRPIEEDLGKDGLTRLEEDLKILGVEDWWETAQDRGINGGKNTYESI